MPRHYQHCNRSLGGHLDNQLEIIRASLAEGADEESRAAGAVACRAVLATLVPDEPTTFVTRAASPANALPAELAAMFAMLKNIRVDQVLDREEDRRRLGEPHRENDAG